MCAQVRVIGCTSTSFTDTQYTHIRLSGEVPFLRYNYKAFKKTAYYIHIERDTDIAIQGFGSRTVQLKQNPQNNT